jgi:hypothetical protein
VWQESSKRGVEAVVVDLLARHVEQIRKGLMTIPILGDVQLA